MSHFVITGAQAASAQGVIPNRLEINDLIKNKDQFSLYIQALIALQDTPQSNQLSHFGVGGIHGLPFEQWDGSGGATGVPGASGGYCCHSTVLFPTWHRPHVALYEQLLQQHALAIANKYQDKQRWLRAAQDLRAPYWDWATNSVPPPEVISLEYLNIVKPEPDDKKPVRNPLYQYNFNPIHPSFEKFAEATKFRRLPFQNWKNTIRYPNGSRSDAKTDVPRLTANLKARQTQLTTKTYNLLKNVHTWPALSNNSVDDGGSASNSLEAIHDSIHVAIGGHMGDSAVAGFDPIFFLHHCNVDRVLALWEALNPGVWVSRGKSGFGTWTIPGDSFVDTTTGLTPFWNSQTSYWNSTEVTTPGVLKYSYPEFNGLDLTNHDAVKTSIDNYIDRQYGSGGGFFSLLQSAPSTGGVGAQEASNVINDWSTRIHVKKYELSGSFSVLIFLGKVPEDPEQWGTAPSFVGAHYAFVNSVAGQCDNCRSQADLVVEGFVHLTVALAELSGLPSYEPSVVRPYLKDNLSWRIQSIDRTAVDPANVPSLEVSVLSTPLSEAPGTALPISGTPEYYPEITYGRPGGARQAQA